MACSDLMLPKGPGLEGEFHTLDGGQPFVIFITGGFCPGR
jgi:hypothetical protein